MFQCSQNDICKRLMLKGMTANFTSGMLSAFCKCRPGAFSLHLVHFSTQHYLTLEHFTFSKLLNTHTIYILPSSYHSLTFLPLHITHWHIPPSPYHLLIHSFNHTLLSEIWSTCGGIRDRARVHVRLWLLYILCSG